MLKIKKDMLLFDDGIKDRLDFIVKYTNNIATFENGNVITIEKTNLHYVEPHRMSIKNPKSIIAKILYFILKIETYQKSPRNYPISAEMKKEIDKLEKYNLQVRFLVENKIDSLVELHVFHEMNKELLNDILYTRKRTYEQKSKSNDSIIKEECNLKVEFYNEIITELQTKIKTCKIIKSNYDKIDIELSRLIINKTEQVR